MKKLLKLGSFSDSTTCWGIYITFALLICRLTYLNHLSISIGSSGMDKFIFYSMVYYTKYLQPLVLLVGLRFICEYLFKLVNQKGVE